MKIRIYYRHVSSHRSTMIDRPKWFSHEICFLNLLGTIQKSSVDIDIELNIIFDGTEAELFSDFVAKYASVNLNSLPDSKKTLNIRRISGGTQRKAGQINLEIALEECSPSNPNDLIYFLENDYLHHDKWLQSVVDLSRSNISWDYLSLYDHLDKYPERLDHRDSRKHTSLRSRILVSNLCHWRTTPSTCASYVVRQEVLQKDFWFLHLGLRDRKFFPILRRVFRRQLLSPIPGLSTHCMNKFLAPCLNWADIAHESSRRFAAAKAFEQ